jgi:hypothetical protein
MDTVQVYAGLGRPPGTQVETREQHQQLGVYYELEDYASVWRRLLIDAVDIPLALAISIVLLAAVASEFDDTPGLLFALLAVTWFGYFVVLKGSRYRTLGYMVAKARASLTSRASGLESSALSFGCYSSLADL